MIVLVAEIWLLESISTACREMHPTGFGHYISALLSITVILGLRICLMEQVHLARLPVLQLSRWESMSCLGIFSPIGPNICSFFWRHCRLLSHYIALPCPFLPCIPAIPISHGKNSIKEKCSCHSGYRFMRTSVRVP